MTIKVMLPIKMIIMRLMSVKMKKMVANKKKKKIKNKPILTYFKDLSLNTTHCQTLQTLQLIHLSLPLRMTIEYMSYLFEKENKLLLNFFKSFPTQNQ
jgi:hypothetical protein